MDNTRQILVECPTCKQPGFFEIWPHIVTTRDAAAYELLLHGKLFKYTCPVCGEVTTMAYDCFFCDVEHTALLFYTAQFESLVDYPKLIGAYTEQANKQTGGAFDSFQQRVVSTTFEFCEKARLLADGYDDRIIELLKVAIKRGMLKDGIVGARDILTYERTMPDGGISFVVTGEIPGDVVGVPQGYTYLQEQWADDLDMLVDEYRFDAAWANAFLP